MAKIKKISDDAFVNDIRHIIEVGLKSAYQSVSSTMVHTYWQIGQRIVEEEQHGEKRAEYGTRLLEFLAEELSQEYATGFSARNLRSYRQLYLNFNDLEIWHTRVPNWYDALYHANKFAYIKKCIFARWMRAEGNN